ncbi:MAG: hypothetical protein Q9171_007541, partial [Xanthocarpia ochracea]
MPKSKDRTLNPAAAQLKADKARALKKGKAAITAQRTARLAQRNPLRLERQIADLKAVENEGGGGGLGKGDKKQLEELERQLGLVRRAREKVGGGDKAVGPFGSNNGGDRERGGGGWGERGRGRGRGGVLGKRNRDVSGQEENDDGGGGSDGSSTDESVRCIPMPRDTPPPLPFHHRAPRRGGGMHSTPNNNSSGRGNANMEPLGESRSRIPHHALPPKPDPAVIATAPPPPKTTYEAKPIVRDLRKEAVKAFMPAVVARKVQAVQG